MLGHLYFLLPFFTYISTNFNSLKGQEVKLCIIIKINADLIHTPRGNLSSASLPRGILGLNFKKCCFSSWQTNQRANFQHSRIMGKAREFQKKVWIIDYAKVFDYVDNNQQWKILKNMEVVGHLTCLLRNLYAGQEATVRAGHERASWFKIVYCHPAYLTSMWRTSCEIQGWLSHKLESRLLGEISTTSDVHICCYCSVAQSCLALCDPTDCSSPGCPVLHHLLEFAQNHVQWVGEIQLWGPLSRWDPIISSSVVHFTSCLQSFLESGSFPMSELFASGGQSIGASALASVLPKNIQDWFPLGWTGLISSLSKGFSEVFSSATVQKHQFFSDQPFLLSSSHICTCLLKKA